MPVSTATASVAPMGVCEPTRAAATASNAPPLNAVAAVNIDSATPPVREGDDRGLCGTSISIASGSQAPHARRNVSDSRSTGGDGIALEEDAGEEADTEEEEDVVVDELDLYCSTPEFLYPSPTNGIDRSSAAAVLHESSAKAGALHRGRRTVGALSSTRASASLAPSASWTASRHSTQRGVSVDGVDDRGEEGPASGQDIADDEGSSETGDCHVARLPLHAQAAASAGLDNAASSLNCGLRDATAPIVGSSRNNDAGGKKRDGVTRQALLSHERGRCRGNLGVGTGLSSPLPSWQARQRYRSGDSDHRRGGREHCASDDESAGKGAATSQEAAMRSTSATTVDTQVSTAPPLRSSEVGAAAALSPAPEAKNSAYMPPLMAELDGELLQLIKAYYLRKQSTAAAAAPLCPPPRAAAESSSTVMPAHCAGHPPNRMSIGSSSRDTVGDGGSRLAGPVEAAVRDRSGGGSNTPPGSRSLLLPADERGGPSGCPRGPVVAPHTAGPLAEGSDATEKRLQELSARHLGGCPFPHAFAPTDSAALTSAAATGRRLGEDVAHLPPWIGMHRLGAHGEVSRAGYGEATAAAASSFDALQPTAFSAASFYDPTAFDEPSRGPHRAAAVRGAATLADGAASAHHQPRGVTSAGSAGGALSSGIASSLSALSSLPSYSSTSFVRAYVSDISLSLEPAIIVSALTAALNIVVVYFLQQHVLDTRDHLGLFLIGSYMVFSSYYMIYYFLERFSDSFRRIASQDKKFYIIGNLIKAGILISITPFACVHLVKIIVFEEWESNILRNLGCIYAIPDFISMVIVRRMRWSTWVHHACVVLFNYLSIMNNYQHENVCRCVVVYAAFSSFAYCVNVLLASRFLGVSANVARVLSFVALVVYALCCAVNWAWQVYYLRRLLTSGHDHWTVYTYMFFISLVMWDDIVLNKWLLHHARNNAYAASQHLPQPHRMRQQHPPAPAPLMSVRLPQRAGPLYRGQGARTIYTAPQPSPPPTALSSGAP
ncbi:hypothetical protein LSCM1_08089 [Leishmania martiniquensis]|uniref:Uncharacterized protein n=1 Tax=Leishmania martiniquensis TaxID=1580590 RepID=A0A836H8C4_9TRYP|nr:hypothetical protein LSCM1_08089 [Leishmania martiniquensis]